MGTHFVIGLGLAAIVACGACDHGPLRTSRDGGQATDAVPDSAAEGPAVAVDAPEADVDRCAKSTGRPLSCPCVDSSECERGLSCVARQGTNGPDPTCGSYNSGYCRVVVAGCLCDVHKGVGVSMCVE